MGDFEIEVYGTDAKEVEALAKVLLEKGLQEKSSDTQKIEVHLHNSIIGILNAGEIEDVESISISISALANSGYSEIAEALKNLTEAIATSQEISPTQRAEVLEQLEELSRQALLPPEKRTKAGVLKAILSTLAATLGAAGGLAEVWSTWGPAIRAFFGL